MANDFTPWFNQDKESVISSNVKSHIFSKQALYPGQPLNHSYIKAGHTVLSEGVYSARIPWFNAGSFSSFQTAMDTMGSDMKKNDIIKIGSIIKIRNGLEYDPENPNYEEYLEDFDLTSNAVTDEHGKTRFYLANSDDEFVIEYHPADTEFSVLTASNNSGMSSERMALRLFKNGVPVERYVSITDKVINGYPSSGYSPDVTIDNVLAVEGEDYYFNSFNGTIVLTKANTTETVRASCFEYVGDTLAATIDKINDSILDNLTSGLVSTTASFDAAIDYRNFKRIDVMAKVKTYNEVIDGDGNAVLVETTSIDELKLYQVYNVFERSIEYIDNQGRVFVDTGERYVDSKGQDKPIYEITGAVRRTEDVRFLTESDINIRVNSGNVYDSGLNMITVPADNITATDTATKLLVLNLQRTGVGDAASYDYKYEMLSQAEYISRTGLRRISPRKR